MPQRGVHFPDLKSSSARRARRSSFPASTSFSICSSHTEAWWRANQFANSAISSRESWAIAASISLTLILLSIDAAISVFKLNRADGEFLHGPGAPT